MKETMSAIKSYHFATNKPGPHLLISAGVHGDEFEPMLAANELARQIGPLLFAGKLTIVPIVNTSAYELGARCGADGLDLARVCPGNETGSITQKLAAQISILIMDADYYIDLHTGGNLFEILPLAGYMLHSNPVVLQQQQEMARAFNLPVVWGTESSPNGRTLSVARDLSIPSIYVEYGGGGTLKLPIVKTYVEGCMNVLKWLNMIASGETPQQVKQYWVEDYIPDNGHFQSKMPAPADGIFSPAVRLGEVVKKKQLWGIIIDPVSGKVSEIISEGEGIVLFLRMSARVKQGDALGGILPVSEPGKKIIGKPV
jgi:predicted deacylase